MRLCQYAYPLRISGELSERARGIAQLTVFFFEMPDGLLADFLLAAEYVSFLSHKPPSRRRRD